MRHKDGEVGELLKNKPENFDDVKEWANFQLAIKSATKKESFLKEMAGLATTLTAIIGVATAAFTAVQLWNKIKQDERDQLEKYQFEALKLYTEHWEEFNNTTNCPRFLVFGSTIKDKYELLAKSVSTDFERLCRVTIGNAEATALVTEEKPMQNTSYNTLEQITPNIRSHAKGATDFSGITVYIQYKVNNESARSMADAIRAFLSSDEVGANAPGKEAVTNVPRGDELRIYKDAQKELADQLRQKLAKKFEREFAVVSLEKFYPKLPANLMEIWIKE